MMSLNESSISVSVVVPTCGRPDLLDRCLASLVSQRFGGNRFEIVVVDDRPAVATVDAVRGWAKRSEAQGGPEIFYIASHGPHGPAAARNKGWRAARGDIIAFTDDDTIASRDWIANGFRMFHEGVGAVCGRIVMPLDGIPTDYELDAKNLETAEFVTANCFCRKAALLHVGGFDERFELAWREDSDLHFRLLDTGICIAFAADAIVTHPVRPAHWGVSVSQARKVQFDALLYKKHRRHYRERIRSRPRWDYYLAAAGMLALPIALAFGSMPGAVLAAGVWLVITGRFWVQRLKGTSKSASHIAEMALTSLAIPAVAVFWRAVGAVRYRVALF